MGTALIWLSLIVIIILIGDFFFECLEEGHKQ